MDLICSTVLPTKTCTLLPPGSSVINLKRNHTRRWRVKVLNMREGFNMRNPLHQRPLLLPDQISTVHRNLDLAFPHRRHDRDVVAHIIPFKREDRRRSPPPDLSSYLLDKRIIYVGWPLYWSVFELVLAELLYLNDQDYNKPAYMYINSTGTTKQGIKFGDEAQAVALHDAMMSCGYPIYTLVTGNAWGEAALLLAAGAKGHRAALPSASIMIKQPIIAVQGQATDIDLARDEVTDNKDLMVRIWAYHTGHSVKKIEEDIRRPKYFSPDEAIEYGLIDKILYPEGRKNISMGNSPESLASHAKYL